VLIVPQTHSVALIAFGFDTLLEIGASTVVIWELKGKSGNRQKRALKYLSIAFLTLGLLYLLFQKTPVSSLIDQYRNKVTIFVP
jgi:hypothetical protein